MKKIEAIIHPSALDAVTSALDGLDVGGITVSEAAESVGEAGFRASYRGASYAVDTTPRLRVEVVADDAYGSPIAWAIAKAARNGHGSEGIVSIHDVAEAVRIRTGERGVAAVTARLDAAEASEIALRSPEAAPRGRRVPLDGVSMSDWTKLLLTNVVLATLVVVVLFHAPVTYAGVGGATAGVLLWARERRAQARRAR